MAKRSRDSSICTSDGGASGEEDFESPRPAKLNMTETSPPRVAIQCSLPPHRDVLDFVSVEDFELHYAQHHANRCSACGKNFPTTHLLALHIDENHNTFRETLQAKGEKTFACFVEDCDRLCSTPQKRRLHLIDKHSFPKIYNFRVVDTGIDKSTSMLQESRRRRVSITADQAASDRHPRRVSRTELKSNPQVPVTVPPKARNEESSDRAQREVENTNLKSSKTVSDNTMNSLEVSMSALQFVPPSVANKHRNRQKLG
ncbi:uncharacterized protein Z518_01614 [Rhinocladiella mackenziei CBS 650.93]|uniref:C2H2-type domain-containing protein n=1 Tax=Rhinocladiella mackenziei CBS 650.93 TaxID=1442369 RepID=A0A0D2J4D6_9EURO|nr:uncharacterized protein Z518_01614 [Rhinocladiella mackenziei CBS 650.93]KIX10531.1 hypothetical protein Z518_01614 [Rhinocladiella mackenziei CBS 650.93]